jgi:hypothetical protein
MKLLLSPICRKAENSAEERDEISGSRESVKRNNEEA